MCSIRPEFGPLACDRGPELANSVEGAITPLAEPGLLRFALIFGILADYASYSHESFDKIYLTMSFGLLG